MLRVRHLQRVAFPPLRFSHIRVFSSNPPQPSSSSPSSSSSNNPFSDDPFLNQMASKKQQPTSEATDAANQNQPPTTTTTTTQSQQPQQQQPQQSLHQFLAEHEADDSSPGVVLPPDFPTDPSMITYEDLRALDPAFFEKDEKFLKELMQMEWPKSEPMVRPESHAILPKDRTVPKKVAAAREKGKLTPTQLLQCFTAYQRDHVSILELTKNFGLIDPEPLFKHYAVPVVYRENDDTIGVYELPDNSLFKPQYLTEHLNTNIQHKKEADEKQRKADEDAVQGNYNFD